MSLIVLSFLSHCRITAIPQPEIVGYGQYVDYPECLVLYHCIGAQSHVAVKLARRGISTPTESGLRHVHTNSRSFNKEIQSTCNSVSSFRKSMQYWSIVLEIDRIEYSRHEVALRHEAHHAAKTRCRSLTQCNLLLIWVDWRVLLC